MHMGRDKTSEEAAWKNGRVFRHLKHVSYPGAWAGHEMTREAGQDSRAPRSQGGGGGAMRKGG